MFKSHVSIVCTVPYDTLTIVTLSLMILRRSSYTSRRIVSTFLGVELVEGRPDLSSSSSDVLPLLKRVPLETPRTTHCPLSICTSYHFRSHRSRFAEFHAKFDVCLLLWFHVRAEIANMKTRGDKHSCCATPNVHTATPLGMLSGDIPCSQALRTHSHTAIGWRSMELVSKLLDTHLCVCVCARVCVRAHTHACVLIPDPTPFSFLLPYVNI